MRILKLSAENVKKLRCVEIVPDPNGSIVQITGANGAGKSSVLDAIFYALAGTKEIPSKPIRNGTTKAFIKLDMGEIVVTRRFSESGSTLTVEGEKGARFPSPQKMLDDMLDTLSFDPLAFSRMDAKKQLETIRGMVKLDVDIDALDALNVADYAQRTEVNRKMHALGAQIHAIVIASGTPDKEIDISALVKNMEEAGAHNGKIERQKAEMANRKRSAIDLRDRAAGLRRQIEQFNKQIEIFETDAAKLEKLNELQPDQPIDTAEVRRKIESARKVNVNVELKAKRAALVADSEKLATEVAGLTKTMQDRIDAKQAAITGAVMPVPGLSFGDGEVLFNGLPLNQASDAERLRVSVAIAMAANPKLRVLRIRDGSLLDDKSLALIASMADDKDFQIWLEKVDSSGKVGIFMEDGEVKAIHA